MISNATTQTPTNLKLKLMTHACQTDSLQVDIFGSSTTSTEVLHTMIWQGKNVMLFPP